MKNRKTKRFLSLFLSLAMLLTTLPFATISSYAAYTNAQLEAIKESATSTYSSKMSTLSSASYTYTNMSAAYEAYDKLVRYIDSVLYGGVTVTDSYVTSLQSALTTAINNMSSYDYPENSVSGMSTSETGLSNAVDEKYTQNLLTTFKMDSGSRAAQLSTPTSYCTLGIYSGDFVWLYDGVTTLVAPINAGWYKSGGTNTRPMCIYTTADDLQIGGLGLATTSSHKDYDDRWHFKLSAGVYYWSFDNDHTSNHYTYSWDSGTTQSYSWSIPNNNSWYQASSYLSYTGGEKTDSSGNALLSWTINPTYKARIYNASYISTPMVSAFSGTIYIINYKPVYETLIGNSSLQSVFSDITSYDSEYVSNLLSYIDALTEIDYNDISTSTSSGVTVVDSSSVDAITTVMEKNIDLINSALSNKTTKADTSTIIATYETESNVIENAVDTSYSGNGVSVDTSSLDTDIESGVYTKSSWAAYEAYVSNIQTYFNTLNPYTTNNSYATDQSVYDELIANISSAKLELLSVADYTPVSQILNNNATSYDTLSTISSTDDTVISDYTTKDGADITTLLSIDEGQVWTFSSHKPYVDAYNTAIELANSSDDVKADTAKYKITYATDTEGAYVAVDSNGNLATLSTAISNGEVNDGYSIVVISDSIYTDSTYSTRDYTGKSQYAIVEYNGTSTKQSVSGYRFSISSVSSSTYSTTQQAINQARLDTDSTYADIVSADTAAAYELYEYVITVAESVNREKYLTNVLTTLDKKVSLLKNGVEYSDTYSQDTVDSAYVNYDGKVYYDTTVGGTDSIVSNFLTWFETVNSEDLKSYAINQYKAQFTVQVYEGDSDTVSSSTTTTYTAFYGETFDFDVSSLYSAYDSSTDSVVWSITSHTGTYTDTIDSSNVSSSQKVTTNSSTYEKIADTNIELCATIYTNKTVEGKNTVYIRNIYNRVVNVVYTSDEIETGTVDTLTINGETYTADEFPFYSFDGWTIEGGDGVYYASASYTPQETYSITVYSDGVTGEASACTYDTQKTISYSGDEEFVAWTAEVDGMYQVVSYDETYTFYVVTEETYYPIVNVDGTYTVNGEAVSAENIENAIPSGYENEDKVLGMSKDDYVIYKLENKYPFVSIQLTTITTNNTKARLYARITTGCDYDVTEFGAIYNSTGSSTEYSIKLTSIIDTSGQYLLTLNKSSAFTNSVDFKAYIAYDMTYTYDSTEINDSGIVKTATINVKDISTKSVAEL